MLISLKQAKEKWLKANQGKIKIKIAPKSLFLKVT